jgi:hypothetical protein
LAGGKGAGAVGTGRFVTGTGTGAGAAGFLGAHAAAKTAIATAEINAREILVVIEWGWSS